MRTVISRRIFTTTSLVAGMLVGATVFFVGPLVSVGAGPDVKLGQNFVVNIEGLPQASENIVGVSVEDLTIDVRDVTEDDGMGWSGFRQYAPGDAHYGKLTLRVLTGKGSQELREWFRQAAAGKNIRKDISIVILDRSGKEARRYDLMETFPMKYDPGDYSPSSTQRVETIVVKIGRLELAAVPIPSNTHGAVAFFGPIATAYAAQNTVGLSGKNITKGFRIEVSGPSGEKNEDTAWETVTGGALEIEVAPASVGSDQTDVTAPGHKFVEEIQLRGPMTASRKWLSTAVNSVLHGQSEFFDITIIEILPGGAEGRRHTYEHCFITRYVYPVLSADGTGNLYEEVSIKPEKLDLQ